MGRIQAPVPIERHELVIHRVTDDHAPERTMFDESAGRIAARRFSTKKSSATAIMAQAFLPEQPRPAAFINLMLKCAEQR